MPTTQPIASAAGPDLPLHGGPVPSNPPPPRPGLVAAARSIAEQLLSHALRTPDGAPFWLKHGSPFDDDGKPVPLGPHFYNGASGISLFLSALAVETGDDGFRNEALASLAPLRRRLRTLAADRDRAADTGLRIGGVIGLGAFLYVFTRIGGWLDEPELIAEACAVATLLTPQRIAADRSLDVMYGAAGALLGLLALEKAAPSASAAVAGLLDRANLCGEHLLASRVGDGEGARAWPASSAPPLPGFAHGSSGIATALARLAARTGSGTLRAAALEGLEFERERFSAEERNWRSTPERAEATMTAWCNGAPGVALGRLEVGALGSLDEARLSELAIALETTLSAPQAVSDFLCCGNQGRAETLLAASIALGRGDLFAAAQEITAGVVARADGDWFGPATAGRNAAFFRGASGIGYSCLRHSGSSLLPNVLTLE